MPGRYRRLILACVLAIGVLPAAGWAQGTDEAAAEPTACTAAHLDDADDAYSLGRFDEVIERLVPCLSGRPGFRKAEITRALRFLALAHLARREPEQSRQAIEQLMKTDRGYRADPAEDPLFFQQLVDELRPPLWYQKRWVQLGGALVVGGVLGYVLTRPGPEPLPAPPPLPGNE